jgi:hypothetical protein
MPDMHRIDALEATVRRQGRWLLVLGSLLTILILAAAQQTVPSGPVKVTIDKPVKIILEDIGYMVRGSHPLHIKQQ